MSPSTQSFSWRFAVALLIPAGLAVAGGCGSVTSRGKNAQGVRLFQQAQYNQAVDQFLIASSRDPGNPDAYYNLGAVYHHSGAESQDQSHLGQAEHYYRLCLERDPNHRECHRGLARLLVQQRRDDEAFALLENWVDRQPLSAEPEIELARLHEEAGHARQAKEHLLASLGVDHRNPRALAALGKIREESGNYEQALANYRRSLQYDRYQTDVAARVALLQSTHRGTGVMPAPSGGAGQTRLATGASSRTLR